MSILISINANLNRYSLIEWKKIFRKYLKLSQKDKINDTLENMQTIHWKNICFQESIGIQLAYIFLAMKGSVISYLSIN